MRDLRELKKVDFLKSTTKSCQGFFSFQKNVKNIKKNFLPQNINKKSKVLNGF